MNLNPRSTARLVLGLAVGALVATGLAACGSSAATTHPATTTSAKSQAAGAPAHGHTAAVAIRGFMFGPMDTTVVAPAKVTFHNFDQTAHTATAENGGFDTGTIEPGHSATVTLTKAGTYTYHCLFHAFMVARITVVQ